MSIVRFPSSGRRPRAAAARAGDSPGPRAAKPPRNVILPLSVRKASYVAGGATLLHDLNFRIEAGRRTAILGCNGAGKSLTLRLCHGLIRPAAGEIVWEGPQGGDPRAASLAQAMVFQKPVLLRRSVRDNLMHIVRLRGFRGHDLQARVNRVLDRCGLLHLASQPARVLSGGEQQKLALARAWIIKPSILFLDEPTASLDPAATLEVEAIINAFHGVTTTVFFSTHDIAQAQRLADHVLFIHHGRILEDVPAAEFFDRPASAQGRAFLRGDPVP